jgi:hypothetical protein
MRGCGSSMPLRTRWCSPTPGRCGRNGGAPWSCGRGPGRPGPLQTAQLLSDPAVCQLIDITLPVAVLFVSVLHAIPESAAPATVLEQAAGLLSPGSLVAASHLVSEDADVRRQAGAVLREAAGGRWGRVRPRAEVEPFFAALRLLTPGLVDIGRWRPGSDRLADAGGRTWAEHGGVALVP